MQSHSWDRHGGSNVVRTMRAMLMIGVAPVLLAACGEQTSAPRSIELGVTPPTSGPHSSKAVLATDLARKELRAAAGGRRQRGAEDEILSVEADVPGVGGIYIDSATQSLTVFVRDDSLRGRAIERVRALTGVNVPRGKQIRTLKGIYAFSELIAWSELLAGDISKLPEFLSIDADERINRVRITVTDLTMRARIDSLIVASGIPAAAFQVEQGTPVVPLQSYLVNRVRPTGGGMELENSAYRCTLGWNVTTDAGESGFITAAHCSTSGEGSGYTGETMYQADYVNTDAVGTVTINPAWNLTCYESSTTPFQGPCTDADALFVSSSYSAKRVALTSGGAYVYNQRGTRLFGSWFTRIGTPQYAYVGQVVDKVGRTTGWTRGTVQGTCELTRVNDTQSSYHLITCGDRVTNASQGPGDSGAPVFVYTSDSSGPIIIPLGVLFAGNNANQYDSGDKSYYCNSNCTYIYSPWATIQQHLARQLYPN